MATERKVVCDRCGNPIVYNGWTGIIKKYPKGLFLRELFDGNPDGYSYADCHLDLCGECCKSFGEWFRFGKVKEDTQ